MKEKSRGPNPRMLIVFRMLFTVCVFGTIVFIFSNSSEIGELSGSKSAAVTEFMNKVMGKLGFAYRFTEHLVRKLAHFCEYMMLGFWMMLALRVYTRRVLSFISWPFFLGLLTAVCDEFYQRFVPGRASDVKDVMIDFGGVSAGVVAGLFVILFFAAFWDALQGKR